MLNGTGLEGGVFQESLKRYSTTTFVYMPHSAVVIPCESARPLRTREKGGDESDPPQKRGGMRTRIAALCSTLLSGPMGSLSSHLSCGKAQNSPPGAALKEGRRTYEMARDWPVLEGALAPARWPDELEKPDPGFRRRGWLVMRAAGKIVLRAYPNPPSRGPIVARHISGRCPQ